MRKFQMIVLAAAALAMLSGCQKDCPQAPACPVCEQCQPCEAAEQNVKAAEDKVVADDKIFEAGAEEIVLPKYIATDVTLTKALENRRSVRQYTDQALKMQDVSNLLWSANGVNREDGKRTAPSARNKQSVTIYATFEKGAYKYDHTAHKLVRLSEDDLRPLKQAPMELIITSIFTSDKPGDDPAQAVDMAHIRGINAGTVAQNVALYCAAAGLGTVIRMIRQRDENTVKALNIADNEYILFNMAVGYEQ